MRNKWLSIAVLIGTLVLALVAAGCGGGDDDGGDAAGDENVSGSVSIMAVWTGPEQEAFQAVLAGFEEKFPNVTTNYTSAGDQLPTQLSTAVEGGNPPDVAVLPQPGLIRDFVRRNALKSLDFARDDVEQNLGESAVQLGSVDDTLYGFLFKAANKSTVWYNVQAFEDAGVEPPETWDELLEAAETLKASGTRAWSIGASDGWTLTDLFENIYAQSAGPEKYRQLAEHKIPWTDPSVKEALTTMGQIFENKDNIAGNALQIDFPTSVSQVFAEEPKAAMVTARPPSRRQFTQPSHVSPPTQS
jgi:ABC-type glycerol-3-phosphate transport system substrate-binding protein